MQTHQILQRLLIRKLLGMDLKKVPAGVPQCGNLATPICAAQTCAAASFHSIVRAWIISGCTFLCEQDAPVVRTLDFSASDDPFKVCGL